MQGTPFSKPGEIFIKKHCLKQFLCKAFYEENTLRKRVRALNYQKDTESKLNYL